MSTYRVSTAGHNIALVSLTVLTPQPRSEGVKATRRDFVGDGSYIEQGLYAELIWDALEDGEAYRDVLTLFGLHANTSIPVTAYLRNEQYEWLRYNGRAIRPGVGNGVSWQDFFVRGVTIMIRDLEIAS